MPATSMEMQICSNVLLGDCHTAAFAGSRIPSKETWAVLATPHSTRFFQAIASSTSHARRGMTSACVPRGVLSISPVGSKGTSCCPLVRTPFVTGFLKGNDGCPRTCVTSNPRNMQKHVNTTWTRGSVPEQASVLCGFKANHVDGTPNFLIALSVA